jgi:hypothetical protein
MKGLREVLTDECLPRKLFEIARLIREWQPTKFRIGRTPMLRKEPCIAGNLLRGAVGDPSGRFHGAQSKLKQRWCGLTNGEPQVKT